MLKITNMAHKIMLILLLLVYPTTAFGSDDTKGKVLQKSHVIKCKNTTGQMAGSKTEYILDKNSMKVKMNFDLSDKALEVFEKAGSPTTKKDTKTWDIQSWDASNIHINMGGNLYSWDGTGWVFSIVGDEYQHDKCKVK